MSNNDMCVSVVKALQALVMEGEIVLWETIEDGGHTVDVSVNTIREARAILDAYKAAGGTI